MKFVPEFVSKFIDSLRNDGAAETFFRLLHRLRLISVLHTFQFIYMDLGDLRISIKNRERGFDLGGDIEGRCREIRENELAQLKFASGMYSIETFKKHFSGGMRFFAAFHQDSVVGVSGVNTHWAHLDYLKLPPRRLLRGVVYKNCAFTIKNYRSLGVGTALMKYTLNQIREEGYQTVFAAIFLANKSALRWSLRNGFRLWGKVTYIKRLGKDYWWYRLTKEGHRLPSLLRSATEKNSPEASLAEAL